LNYKVSFAGVVCGGGVGVGVGGVGVGGVGVGVGVIVVAQGSFCYYIYVNQQSKIWGVTYLDRFLSFFIHTLSHVLHLSFTHCNMKKNKNKNSSYVAA
jgi:hypothetical protein